MVYSTEVTGIPSDDVDKYWEHVEPLLAKACERGNEYLPIDLYQNIREGKMQLWVAFDENGIMAAATTEIRIYPRLRVCGVTHVGGKGLKAWGKFIPMFEEWAKEHGCSRIEGYMRPGWLRYLKDWTVGWTFMFKELK